jgi:hypothetical protein
LRPIPNRRTFKAPPDAVSTPRRGTSQPTPPRRASIEHRTHSTKSKPATKPSVARGKAAASDACLINEWVIYAQEIATFNAGFKADPDGGSKHAAGLGDQHYDRAQQALTKMATMKASTPAGLDAKAHILPVVIQDSGGSLQDADEAFCGSFAADVRAFLDPLVHADWLANKDTDLPAPLADYEITI